MTDTDRIAFEVAGYRVVGNLHLPSGEGPHPAVFVAGPMTSVKEQVTGVYAQALAARGIAALAIDHRHYGESEGTPRQYECHPRKIEDLKAAASFLAQDPRIAADRIGAVGVCLGVGYAMWAAAENPLIRSIGAVAGYYRNPTEMRRNDVAGFDAKVRQGRRAREAFETSGRVETIPAASLTGDAAMQTADTVDYYTSRAAVPTYTNAFAIMSREFFLPFDVMATAPQVSQPVAMVHSENALSPHWARQFHDALSGQASIRWLTSTGQTDFYDDPNLVTSATDIIADHLHHTLFQ